MSESGTSVLKLLTDAVRAHGVDSAAMIRLIGAEGGHMELARMCDGYDDLAQDKKVLLLYICWAAISTCRVIYDNEDRTP